MQGSNSPPFLVVGLGNPGSKYRRTPHNLGFEISELLAKSLGPEVEPRTKFEAIYSEHVLDGRKVICVRPQTFMNLSGNAVRDFVRYFKCNPSKDMVVVTDDLDLPPGKLRLRMGGGPGGHNGLRSITDELGTEGFARLRVGIGRDPEMAPDKYVLKKVDPADWDKFSQCFDKAIQTLKMIPTLGMPKAMDFCNQKEVEEKKI